MSETNLGAKRHLAYKTSHKGTIGRKYGFFRILVVTTDRKSALELRGEGSYFNTISLNVGGFSLEKACLEGFIPLHGQASKRNEGDCGAEKREEVSNGDCLAYVAFPGSSL